MGKFNRSVLKINIDIYVSDVFNSETLMLQPCSKQEKYGHTYSREIVEIV